MLVLLPFYSSFVLGFFFFLTAMGLLWLRDLIKKRVWNPVFLGGIALMTTIYLAIEYRLLLGLVFAEAPKSREEFVNSTLGFWHSLLLALGNFIFGHSHVLTMHTLVILPVLVITLRIVIIRRSGQVDRRFIYLLVLNGLLSLWYAFWYNKAWEPLKERFSLLDTFNFARFHFLRPLVIYLGFALGLYILWRLGGDWRKRVRWFLVLQVVVLFCCNDEIVYRVYGEPTFKQFYAVDQFEQIKTYIGQPQDTYRVASIGIHPVIAQYNGFYTLDTYNNYYPLTYKHDFRRIIARELDKDQSLKTYFDQWGSRYIFSAVPIMNANEDGLRLLKTFDNAESAWRIYLYGMLNPIGRNNT
ncbi:hypothetical protein GZH47_24460 [Paenibacillus rhizovicinus]|uniref:Uncharacterized protein n=1 Tax=Paenibacillus rhizovicinus TaxID=2704463 RepID=A0A6C0P525_9BACL|nr:hypothetical protein GZH47_24460 [Paenibacillus rhizovicinus]